MAIGLALDATNGTTNPQNFNNMILKTKWAYNQLLNTMLHTAYRQLMHEFFHQIFNFQYVNSKFILISPPQTFFIHYVLIYCILIF
jgi:hypothetical protein